MTRGRAIAAAMVGAFAIMWGHLAWQAWLGPPPSPEYFVEFAGPALVAGDRSARNLYLRRVLAVTQRPRHAWLQVISHDRLRVYVNGEMVAGEDRDGLPVATVIDLTARLRVGSNVIAITARQASVNQPPAVAIAGEYTASDGHVLLLQRDTEWRAATHLEGNWLAQDFHDRHWASAATVPVSLRSVVHVPPRAITTRLAGAWITPPRTDAIRNVITRDFTVPGRPRRAWLRMAVTSAYRVTINGVLLDEREDYVGTDAHAGPIRRTYDITTLVRSGSNTIAVTMTRTAGTPHLIGDLEVENWSGRSVHVVTDGAWMARSVTTAVAEPCRVESTDVGFPPHSIAHDHVELTLPLPELAQRRGIEAMFIVALAVSLWLLCRLVRRRIGPLAYVAFLPPTAVLAAAMLATYDSRISSDALVDGPWVVAAAASVPVQWLLLAVLGRAEFGRRSFPRPALREAIVVFTLVIVGGSLRISGITAESLQWDEVEHYEYTMGFLERGFPSRIIHPHMPIAYVHTSELMFVPSAMAALVFDDPRLVMRVPAVCWSVLTIVLVYAAGRRMFTPAVGLVAAALLAFSPVVIAMSTVGRYFAQLQFFALLVIVALWQTVRGEGAIDKRALGVTAAAFLAMYLTWEGSAFLAVGLSIAALMHRRRQLQSVVLEPSVWAALTVVAMVLVLQYSHVVLEQTKFLWYGTSLSDLRIRPMWQYPTFQPWFYVWASSWSLDALLPMLALAAAILLAARHAFRSSLRFLLVVHLTTCLFMSTLLPAITSRYIHHLVPVLVLLGAATIVAVSDGVLRFVRDGAASSAGMLYARSVAAVLLMIAVAAGSGYALDLRDMPRFRVDGFDSSRFKFPNVEGAAHYVRDRLQSGDVVLATDPFQVKHFTGPTEAAPTFYWPASTLQMSATLDDVRPIALDRRDGTPAVANLESVRALFERSGRIWYVIQPERHENQNMPEVSTFLRQHMDVVYEDFEAVVLLRDRNHRAARDRYNDERDLGFGNRHRTNFPAEPRGGRAR